jgi:GNAT superfamily N-acetyltransferase
VKLAQGQVRSAKQEDATAIGQAHSEAWRVGFAGLFEPAWLAEAVRERRTRWQEALGETRRNGTEVLVSESDGAVTGFAHFGAGDETATIGEVFALYVRPDSWGTGTAQALTRDALGRLRRQGFERTVLWTPMRAARARTFYVHNGWSLTGRMQERDFGDGRPQPLVEYARLT